MKGLALAAMVVLGCQSSGSPSGGARVPEPVTASPDQPTAPEVPTEPNPSPAPSVDPTKLSTLITVRYPSAGRQLGLRGGTAPLGWETTTQLTAEGGDRYSLVVELAAGTTLELKPVLEDQGAIHWARGENYRVRAGASVEIFPRFFGDAGKVEVLLASFHSNVLANERDIWVYYPPSYFENTSATYPVLYMHDGQNLFFDALSYSGEWHVDETLDAGAWRHDLAEVVVIGIDNTADRIYEYTPTDDPTDLYPGGGGDTYLSMIVNELAPEVEKRLRLTPGPSARGILGSSLGGLISAYAGVRCGGFFGVVGAMSPSTWWHDRFIIGELDHTPQPPDRPLRVYVDSGNCCNQGGDDVANTRELAGRYVELGYVEGSTLNYVVQDGASHSERFWAERLPAALRFLFPP